MSQPIIQVYVLGEIPEPHLQGLLTVYNTTSAPDHALNTFDFNTVMIEPSLTPKSTTEIINHHFDVRPSNALVQPIWVLDEQSLEDQTLRLVVPASDLVEGSEAKSCRVTKEWVNAVTANLSIGHMDASEYVDAARDGVFRGF